MYLMAMTVIRATKCNLAAPIMYDNFDVVNMIMMNYQKCLAVYGNECECECMP